MAILNFKFLILNSWGFLILNQKSFLNLKLNIKNSSFLLVVDVPVVNFQIESADLVRNRQAPVNGPAVITEDDIPQAEIKGQVQCREDNQDFDEPLVENDG